MFDGVKANLTKGLSMEPGFQVTHAFAMGSQTAPPSYNFSAVFAKSNVSPRRIAPLSLLTRLW